MPNYRDKYLKIKTLVDLRKLVKGLDDYDDDYEIKLDSFSYRDYSLTDDVDVSYPRRTISITLDN